MVKLSVCTTPNNLVGMIYCRRVDSANNLGIQNVPADNGYILSFTALDCRRLSIVKVRMVVQTNIWS